MRLGAFVPLAVLAGLGAARPLAGQYIAPPGRICERLPAVRLAALADDSLLRTRLGAAPWVGIAQALVSIDYDPDGRPQRVRMLAATIDSTGSRIILQGVAEAVRDLPIGQGPGARLLITVDDGLSFQSESATYCPPVREGPPEETQTEVVERSVESRTARIRTPTARVTIRSDGSVERVDLDTSSGVAQIDQMHSRYLEKGQYQPALVDGLPIRVRLTIKGR